MDQGNLLHVVQKEYQDYASLADLENQVIDNVLNEIWTHYNDDGNEFLDREEITKFIFITLVENGDRQYDDIKDLENDPNALKCFDDLDDDGSGTIDKEELRQFIKDMYFINS